VFGDLGILDSEHVLTLNGYDAEGAKSVGRRIVRGASVSAVGAVLESAVVDLVGPAVSAVAAKPVRVLVMNIRCVGERYATAFQTPKRELAVEHASCCSRASPSGSLGRGARSQPSTVPSGIEIAAASSESGTSTCRL